MNNEHRFTELLNRYLDDNTTAQERDELLGLIREGAHDEALRESIQATLQQSPAIHNIDSQTAGKLLKEILATNANEPKVVRMWGAAVSWTRVAAAAVVIVSLTAGWWLFRVSPSSTQVIAVTEKAPESAVFTGKQYVRLPDGSSVLLNEGSELSYSSSFGRHSRVVTLSGEGYFDVQHDPSRPFKVLTGNVTTTVLGTAFNVKAYPGQDEIKVTVTRGKVQVGDDQRTFAIIQPDQQLSVNTATNDFVKTELSAETADAWKSQYLILDDISIGDAVVMIEEKYHVNVEVANEDLKKCRITATFLNDENLEQVLMVVTGVVRATYTILPDGSVSIEGRGCK